MGAPLFAGVDHESCTMWLSTERSATTLVGASGRLSTFIVIAPVARRSVRPGSETSETVTVNVRTPDVLSPGVIVTDDPDFVGGAGPPAVWMMSITLISGSRSCEVT